jgi:hypothetical protein
MVMNGMINTAPKGRLKDEDFGQDSDGVHLEYNGKWLPLQ